MYTFIVFFAPFYSCFFTTNQSERERERRTITRSMVTRVVFVPFLFCTAVFVDTTSATGLRYRPGLKVVNHVETLGMAGTSYSPYSKVRDSNPMKNIDVPMVPFQPLQPGQSVRGDDSFPLASPMQTAPYPFTAKAPEVKGIGGITDKEGMRMFDVSSPDWLTRAREHLGLSKGDGSAAGEEH